MEKMVQVEPATQDELRQDLKSLYGRPGVRCDRPGSLRIPRIRDDEMTRFRGQTSLQGPENPAVEAVRTPSPYLYPSGKPALACPRNTPEKAPSLDEEAPGRDHWPRSSPRQSNFNPVTRPPSAAMDLRSYKVIGMLRNH